MSDEISDANPATKSVIKQLAAVLEQERDDVEQESLPSSQQLDCVCTDNGQEYWLPYSASQELTPATVLAKIAGVAAEYNIHLVSTDQRTASRIADILRYPYAGVANDAVELYNSPHPVTISDEDVLVRHDCKVTWTVDCVGNYNLKLDGETVFSRGISFPNVDGLEFPLYLCNLDDQFADVVETESRLTIDINTEMGTSDEWHQLRWPFSPSRPTFVQEATLHHLNEEGLSRYQYTSPTGAKRPETDVAVNQFLQEYTHQPDSISILFKTLVAHFQDWYRGLYGAPVPAWHDILDSLPEADDVQVTYNQSNRNIFISNRSWRLPLE
ncbi:hypothetical protein [Haloarcula marismortui]|uniref:Uncharacterized protein n=1 Tax=Haloarcula marismortui ATCC 33799 TaxID=662475 RepID=M0JKV1_9EURY|nr:hypothetical protein [Haloarcula californiae]EMA09631.1 hypothetical protein C435_21275 [Haloarcula californiae ATCC 33799]